MMKINAAIITAAFFLHGAGDPPNTLPGGARMTEIVDILISASFWAAVLRIASPLIFATMGELICERAGVLNLGIEAKSCSAMSIFCCISLSCEFSFKFVIATTKIRKHVQNANALSFANNE